MPRPKIIRENRKDHKVTIRLDNDTYQSLKEAVEQGKISNLSEVLRGMIRQKVWEVKFSKEMERDLKSGKISDEGLHSAVQSVWGALKSASVEDKESAKSEGFLEGLFSVIGGFVRKAIEELDRKESEKKKLPETNTGGQSKIYAETGKDSKPETHGSE